MLKAFETRCEKGQIDQCQSDMQLRCFFEKVNGFFKLRDYYVGPNLTEEDRAHDGWMDVKALDLLR